MEEIFLLIITGAAAFYLYKKLFKSGGCNCGDKSKSCGKK